MSSAIHRGMALSILCIFVSACSGSRADSRAPAKDPGAPAVVQVPAVVLPSDTIKKDSTPDARSALEAAKRSIAGDFAVLGAAIAFGDRRMIATTYAPDAEVITPEKTYTGSMAIASGLGRLGPSNSLAEFRRRSLAMRIVDSTVVDSGVYIVLTKRVGADSVFERGRYATTWRIHAPPLNWLITRDHFYRESPAKPK